MNAMNFGTFFRILKSTITDSSISDEEFCNLIFGAILDQETKSWFTIRSDTVSKLKNNHINIPKILRDLFSSAEEHRITEHFEKEIFTLLEPLKLNAMKASFLAVLENEDTIHPKIKKEVMQYAETDQMLPFLVLLFRISMLHENKLKKESMQAVPIFVCEKELSFEEKNRRFCFYLSAFQNENIKKIEIATQVGLQLIENEQMNYAMIRFLERGGKLSILINSEEKRWEIGDHMKSEDRYYIKTEQCIAYWKRLKIKFPKSLTIFVTEIPLLHSIFFTAIEEEIDSAIYVSYYTYTAYNLESVPQLLVHPEEEYFDIYLSELRYLQEHAEEII